MLDLLLALITFSAFGASDGPGEGEVAVVKERLGNAQILSFADDREYCGYLIRLPDGALGFTELVRGDRDGCTPLLPLVQAELVASVHTHGAYGREVPAEFPTTLDMESDEREGLNGYVATPGGRLWYIDSARMKTWQLCGLGCLPQDPEFRAGDDGVIAQSYRYSDLERIENR